MADETAEATTTEEQTGEDKPKRKKRELTPEQIAKREERKKRRAEKEAKFEADLVASKEAHPQVWTKLDELVSSMAEIPTEEKATVTPLVAKVFRNRLRPGRKAISIEKAQARLERLKKQQAKLLVQMGEPVPEDLQKYLDAS